MRQPTALAFAVFLVAFNMRPALTSVAPLLPEITVDAGLGPTGAAWLTTVPVVCLGLGGALATGVARRVGVDRGILHGMVLIAAGLGIRVGASPRWLYAGTVLPACGIGLAGVLLPALIKRDFAGKAGRVTGLYTTILCLGAAVGAGLSVPLRDWLGGSWAMAISAWSAPALLATTVWLPFAKRSSPVQAGPAPADSSLLSDPLAWQVTGYMGLQSSLAYVQFGWLPLLLIERGLEPSTAGYLTGLSTLAQVPGALVVGQIAGRRREHRSLITGVVLAALAGFLMLSFGPWTLMVPSALLLGLASGASFALGLILIVVRTRNAADAGRLSAMAQGIGYVVASFGPFAFGFAHQSTGGWRLSALIFAGFCLGAIACGMVAGRDRYVREHGNRRLERESPARS